MGNGIGCTGIGRHLGRSKYSVRSEIETLNLGPRGGPVGPPEPPPPRRSRARDRCDAVPAPCRRCNLNCMPMSETAAPDYAERMPPSWAEAIARAPNPYEVSWPLCPGADRICQGSVLAEPDDWQLKVLRALARGHTRIAVRSCHGPGKTALAAWVAVWFSNTRAPFKLAMTAPSSPQLFDALYPEVIKWLDRLPGAWRELWHVTSDHITLKANSECFITARTSRPETPEALAGLHSDNILLVVDEASGVPEQVFEAASGSMSSAGAITLLIGNPTRSSGFFWKAFMLERDRWFTMKVGYQDSPRVTQDFADEIAGRYGQDSNAYRVRVLGEFPLADADTLIPAELVDSAMVRDTPMDGSPRIVGRRCREVRDGCQRADQAAGQCGA